MSINRESEVAANLQIGPTDLGMVRVYIATETIDLPLDFEPEEAEEIAEELRASAARARAIAEQASKEKGGDKGRSDKAKGDKGKGGKGR